MKPDAAKIQATDDKHCKKTVFFCILSFVFCNIAVFILSCNEHKTSLGMDEETSTRSLLSQAKKIIEKALESDDFRIRSNAIEVVGTTPIMDFLPDVVHLLSDDYVPVRFAAALAVGDTKYSHAKKEIITLLKAPDNNTRLSAAYALYMLGDKSKLNTISEFISSSDMQTRANAAMLLGKTANKAALNTLYWALKEPDSDDKVRFQAVESIARLGDEKIYPKLWTMMININADDRMLGVESMGALGTEQAKGALTSQLSDEVLEVRLAAAQQLGKLGSSTGKPEVLAVFNNNLTATMEETDAERVNILTALAIGQIRTPELTKFLPRLLNNKSKFVQLAAAKAVFQCQLAK